MEIQITGKMCVEMYKRLELIPNTDKYEHPSQLVGLTIQRDDLMDSSKLDKIADLLHEFKAYYSAGGMSCLRGNLDKQKTPIVNALRQISKANGLHLKPCSKSHGYWPNGKKKVHRWFEIHSLDESLEEIRCQTENAQENALQDDPLEKAHAKAMALLEN